MPWNELWTGDCLQLLPKIQSPAVDLIFADPPFNIGYEYDVYNDNQEREHYLDWTIRWLSAAAATLKPDGSMWVAIGDEYAAEMKIRLDALGLSMRNWVIWHYTFGVNCSKKFNRSHAHLFYYVKNPKQFTFNADPVRVASARMTTYSDRRANPVGKLPDDTWFLRPQDSETHFSPFSDTWSVSRVCGTFKERTDHPCQMPEALLERVILACSNEGDLVLDPFAGSGTTLAVAKKLNRSYLGMELSEEYSEAIKGRLQAVKPQLKEPKSVPRTPGSERTQAAGLKPR
jgi:DNA modification methylase